MQALFSRVGPITLPAASSIPGVFICAFVGPGRGTQISAVLRPRHALKTLSCQIGNLTPRQKTPLSHVLSVGDKYAWEKRRMSRLPFISACDPRIQKWHRHVFEWERKFHTRDSRSRYAFLRALRVHHEKEQRIHLDVERGLHVLLRALGLISEWSYCSFP